MKRTITTNGLKPLTPKDTLFWAVALSTTLGALTLAGSLAKKTIVPPQLLIFVKGSLGILFAGELIKFVKDLAVSR